MEERVSQLPRSVAALEKLERALQRLETASVGRDGDLFAARHPQEADIPKEDLRTALSQVEARLDALAGRVERILGD